MSEDEFQAFVDDIMEVVETNIKDNAKGLQAISNEYWIGRLFSTQDIKRDIEKVIKNYTKEVTCGEKQNKL